MQELTPKKIADALCVTEKRIAQRAAEEQWRSMTRDGATYYVPDTLPAEVRLALSVAETQSEVPELLTAGGPERKKWQQEIFLARLALYREFERLKGIIGYKKAVAEIVGKARIGRLPEHLQRLVPIANARSGKKRGRSSLSESTVKKWARDVNNGGIEALVPKPAKEAEHPAWADLFCKYYHVKQKPSVAEAVQEMENNLPPGMVMPSYGQVNYWHKKRSKLEQEKGRHGPGAMKKFQEYVTRTTKDMYPGEVYQCDGHSFKAKVRHPGHGKPFHPEVCHCIDIVTKCVTGWSAGLAESAVTVSGAIRHALIIDQQKIIGGTPAMIFTDQGAGNKSALVSDEVVGLLARAGITTIDGLPGNAQTRGVVEKSNQKLWIRPAKRLATYTGPGMDKEAERKRYLEMDRDVRANGTCTLDWVPTWMQFLDYCQAAVDEYNNIPHRSLPKIIDNQTKRKRHMTPLEAWADFWNKGWRPSILPADIIEDLTLPQVVRKAHRGRVTWMGNDYSAAELVHYDGDVIVEYDIHKADFVKVRDMEGRFICKAPFKRNKRRFVPVSYSEKAIENREKNRLAAIKRKEQEILAESRGTVTLEQGQHQLTAEEEAQAGQLLAESKPQPHQVDIEAEYQALNANLLKGEEPKVTNVIDITPRVEELQDQEVREVWRDLDGWERYDHLRGLREKTDEQVKWMAYYETTSEYQALSSIYDDMEANG